MQQQQQPLRKGHNVGVWLAAMQAELGETAVTGVVSVSVSEEGSEAHFEAFQASSDRPATSPIMCMPKEAY